MTDTNGPAAQVRSVVSSLAVIGPEGLTQAQRVEALAALESIKGAAAAAQARLTDASVTDREALGEQPRSVRADIALARKCSPSLGEQYVSMAKALVNEMPVTMAALTRGEISEYRAMILVRETACLSAAHRGEVDKRLHGGASTLGDRALAGAARRAGAELDAEALAARNRRAVAGRRMSVRAAVDGVGLVALTYPCAAVPSALAR